MKNLKRSLALLVITGTAVSSLNLTAFAQAPTPESAAPRAGRTNRPAATADNFPRAADALERVSWRTRTHLDDERLTAWKFGISAAGLGNPTFQESVIRVDAAGVSLIEGSSAQKVSAEIPKNLDPSLTAEEITAMKRALGPVRFLTYRTTSLGANTEARRKTFEFAKAIGTPMLVVPLDAAAIGEIESLANEFEVNVAFAGRPETVMQALEGRSKRLGLAAEIGTSMEHNRTPLNLLAVAKDRLMYASLRDRSALGADARNVMLGQGVGQFTEFFHQLSRSKVRPVTLVLDTTGLIKNPGDIFPAVDAFEAVVQPAYGAVFTEWSRTKPSPRLELDDRSRTLGNRQVMPDAEMRAKMAEAVKTVSMVKPKKARKLLVIESLHGMYHNPGIPNCNVLIDMMSKATGAWETIFSNDLNNLKYPKIKEYDAIFVNSAVNEMFPDPLVREGLERFVKEGGGLGGIHGTPWASRNWQAFADMIGARSAPHRIEDGVMKVYDPTSPLAKSFGGKDFPFREEFYRFEKTGYNRLMWENMRVVLSVETGTHQDNAWNGNNYPVTWIRSYGQGRTYYCSLGHMAETFMQPEIVAHLFAGIQFILGDLEADTTPNPISKP